MYFQNFNFIKDYTLNKYIKRSKIEGYKQRSKEVFITFQQ